MSTWLPARDNNPSIPISSDDTRQDLGKLSSYTPPLSTTVWAPAVSILPARNHTHNRKCINLLAETASY